MSNEAIIHLSKANIQYGKSIVLSDVEIDIHKGEFVYLIGRTGTGKSSLLKTLYGELKLQEGIGEISGYDLKKVGRKKVSELRRTIGIVFQDFQLLRDRSIKENLIFVMKATGWKDKAKMNAKVSELLGLVGVADKENSLPHQLSGGEQQRVAIARALVNRPSIILADEPTGNLDSVTSLEVLTLFQQLNEEGVTVVLVTHEQDIAQYMGRIIRLKDGIIIQDDKINSKLLARDKLLTLKSENEVTS